LLRNRFAIATESLRNRFAIDSQSLRNRVSIAVLSLQYFAQPLCNRFTIAAQSIPQLK
jgi:hypothetical protein